MKQYPAYDDAVDLLDADHKAVKQMFIEFGAMCEADTPPAQKRTLAERICNAFSLHAQLEEISYPQSQRSAMTP